MIWLIIALVALVAVDVSRLRQHKSVQLTRVLIGLTVFVALALLMVIAGVIGGSTGTPPLHRLH